MLIASVGKPLILLLLTDKWAESIIYLQIYVFAVMFNHIDTLNLRLLQVKGRSDLFLNLDIVKKIIGIVILFAAIPFGVIGVCISKILSYQIVILIDVHFTGKLFGLSYFQQMKDFMSFFPYSLVSCLPVYLLCEYADLTDITRISNAPDRLFVAKKYIEKKHRPLMKKAGLLNQILFQNWMIMKLYPRAVKTKRYGFCIKYAPYYCFYRTFDAIYRKVKHKLALSSVCPRHIFCSMVSYILIDANTV